MKFTANVYVFYAYKSNIISKGFRNSVAKWNLLKSGTKFKRKNIYKKKMYNKNRSNTLCIPTIYVPVILLS